MFHILSPNVLLNQIEQVFSNELADLLIMFPTLKENVTKNLLWGIFTNHSIYSKTEHFQQDQNYVFSFDYSLIEQTKKELKNRLCHLNVLAPSDRRASAYSPETRASAWFAAHHKNFINTNR